MSNSYNTRNKIIGMNTNYSLDGPAPVDYNMGQGIVGSYDSIILRPKDWDKPGGSTWKAFPNNPPLLKGPLFVPMGAGVPLHSTAMSPPENSMFIFSRNIASPACKSSFSTSTGNLCLNKQQRDYIGVYRGSNKTLTGDNEY